jgi:hypothetical protein
MALGPELDAIERCQREIAEIERLLRSGHRDLEGLLRALSDWSAELRLLQNEQRRTLDRRGR